MVDSWTVTLRGSIQGCTSVKDIQLHSDAKVSALAPDDVVLISGGEHGRAEIRGKITTPALNV